MHFEDGARCGLYFLGRDDNGSRENVARAGFKLGVPSLPLSPLVQVVRKHVKFAAGCHSRNLLATLREATYFFIPSCVQTSLRSPAWGGQRQSYTLWGCEGEGEWGEYRSGSANERTQWLSLIFQPITQPC
jgi:hypothetical protein